MKIEEYKKQFACLFKELQEEHGKPKCVYVSTEDICDDTGYVIESKIVCSIDF